MKTSHFLFFVIFFVSLFIVSTSQPTNRMSISYAAGYNNTDLLNQRNAGCASCGTNASQETQKGAINQDQQNECSDFGHDLVVGSTVGISITIFAAAGAAGTAELGGTMGSLGGPIGAAIGFFFGLGLGYV